MMVSHNEMEVDEAEEKAPKAEPVWFRWLTKSRIYLSSDDQIDFTTIQCLVIIKAIIKLIDSLKGFNLVKKPTRGEKKFRRQHNGLLRGDKANLTWIQYRSLYVAVLSMT